ncbi:MAG: hypothetical protein OEV60_11500 [Actinomycetota bacterium]|nr:hypothetical protein [Actinomycetota bacterium]MDH5223299.1 hypothetical protein [Actinomycetota bacterium]
MRVRAFLADGVQAVEGKLYVLGAGWNRLATRRFPARHDRVGIGALIVLGDGEEGRHSLTLRLLDPNGAAAVLATDAGGTAQHAIRLGFGASEQTDGFDETIVPFALNLDGLVFSEPGTYSFELRVDEQEPEWLPFKVDLVSEEADGVPPDGGATSARTAADPGYL